MSSRAAVSLAMLLAVLACGRAQAQMEGVVTAPTVQTAARWGQASALMDGLFVVQGGKTQGVSGGQTYSSAPNTAEMYVLDLSTSFDTAAAPWESVMVNTSGANAPAVSFHTLSPLGSDRLLIFGGDGSPAVPVQTNNDSAYIAALAGSNGSRQVQYSRVDASWHEPMRRVYHTSESDTDGRIWIIGGERDDGSSILLDELWMLNSTEPNPTFSSSSPAPPSSIAGATSTLLSDGTLLLLGGVDSNGQLQNMSQIYTYSTAESDWRVTATAATTDGRVLERRDDPTGAVPSPRRGHVAVSLPNRRVFIQGGASADLSTSYSDAWLLDWSVNPPVWTQLNSTGGPGARYGHAAVAYGRKVIITFGWSGGNAADASLYVFDGTTMSSSSSGSWSGGGWSTTYTPDPEALASNTGTSSGPSAGTASAPSSNSGASPGSGATSSSSPGSTHSEPDGGNGSSTSSGGESPSDDDGGSASTTDSFPTSVPSATTDAASGKAGSSSGETAGAAIGALVGAGLVVGAGYAIYRQRSARNNWRRGEGTAGLLERPGGGGNDDDDGFIMEKSTKPYPFSNDRPYDGDRFSGGGFFAGGAAAAVAGAGIGVAAGKRMQERRGDSSSPWTAANVGHAMEGSGPHFRERLAIFTGLRQNAGPQQPRFDMLADEEDGNSYRVSRWHRDAERSYGEDDDDDADAEDRAAWQGDHLMERSDAALGHARPEDLSIGDIGGSHAAFRAEEGYLISPFEDGGGRNIVSAGKGLLAGAGTALAGKRAYDRLSPDAEEDRDVDDRYSDQDDQGPSSDAQHSSALHSAQSHANASAQSTHSGTFNSGQSQEAISPGGFVSFSDASYGRSPRLLSPMKRSPTWWDRLRANSFLERSASGRFLIGPGAEAPIRDPAQPPELDMIAESPANFGASTDDDPFRDGAAAAEQQHMRRGTTYAFGLDEMGRRKQDESDDGSPFSVHQQQQSLSSLNSNRTATSSQLEYQLRNMQVIQRVRTGSSRRTASTRAGSLSDTESVALSRGPSMLRPQNLVALEEGSTPGSVVWQPSNWIPSTTHEEVEETDADADEAAGATSTRAGERDAFESLATSDGKPVELGARLDKAARRAALASETPSITPATTKRARLNPLLTSPLRPEPAKSSQTILSGSVRDRVKAIEEQDSRPATLPPSSPSAKVRSTSPAAMTTTTTKTPSSHAHASTASSFISCTTISPAYERTGPLVTTSQLSSIAAAAAAAAADNASSSPSRSADGPERSKSPPAGSGAKPKLKYSHGLVPKPQLFVANPDDRRTSSGSS